MRELFAIAMTKIFGDYLKFLTFLDDVPLFNVEGYIINRNSKDKEFYNEFSQTQIFRQFLQNNLKEQYPYFLKLTSSNNYKINKKESVKSNSVQSKLSTRETGESSNSTIGSLITQNNPDKFSENEGAKNSCLILPSFIPSTIIENSENFYDFNEQMNSIFSKNEENVYISNENNLTYISTEDFANFIHKRNYNRYHLLDIKPKVNANNFKEKLEIFGKIALNDKLNNNDKKIINERRKLTFISKTKTKKEEELSLDEQDEIKQIITEYLTMIFTSEPLDKFQKNNLQNLFKSNYCIGLFATLIFQVKFKEHKAHCLSNDSFTDLYHMVSSAFLCYRKNKQYYSSARLITKSLFYYYK